MSARVRVCARVNMYVRAFACGGLGRLGVATLSLVTARPYLITLFNNLSA